MLQITNFIFLMEYFNPQHMYVNRIFLDICANIYSVFRCDAFLRIPSIHFLLTCTNLKHSIILHLTWRFSLWRTAIVFRSLQTKLRFTKIGIRKPWIPSVRRDVDIRNMKFVKFSCWMFINHKKWEVNTKCCTK